MKLLRGTTFRPRPRQPCPGAAQRTGEGATGMTGEFGEQEVLKPDRDLLRWGSGVSGGAKDQQ